MTSSWSVILQVFLLYSNVITFSYHILTPQIYQNISCVRGIYFWYIFLIRVRIKKVLKKASFVNLFMTKFRKQTFRIVDRVEIHGDLNVYVDIRMIHLSSVPSHQRNTPCE